ncbi:MAG: haloacid dehalogenase-like hydrolase [Phycisphaeraceae bacterium]
MRDHPFLLLWDIDGTIVHTGGAGMRAMFTVAHRMFGADFRWDGIEAAGHLDPLIFAEAAILNCVENHEDRHEAFRDSYLAELEKELRSNQTKVHVPPGVHHMLALLHRRAREQGDVVLGLLTGNYRGAAPLKLAAAGVDPAWFTVTAFGDEGQTRADLVGLALRKFAGVLPVPAVDPRRVVVIGDTPRDVACATAHGCVALAVATGGYSVETLRQAGADVVTPDLSNPRPLLDLLDPR